MAPVVLAAAGLAVAAVPASARVVVDASIARGRLGDTPAAVRAKLGAPGHRSCVGIEPKAHRCDAVLQTYGSRKLSVLLLHDRVASLDTSSKRQRTNRGVGPGVPEKRAEQRYPNGHMEPGGAGPSSYFLSGRAAQGQRYTFVQFTMRTVPDDSPSSGGGRHGDRVVPDR